MGFPILVRRHLYIESWPWKRKWAWDLHTSLYVYKQLDPGALNFLFSLIARFMGTTWGPSGADRTQVGPMSAPWTMLSGFAWYELDPVMDILLVYCWTRWGTIGVGDICFKLSHASICCNMAGMNYWYPPGKWSSGEYCTDEISFIIEICKFHPFPYDCHRF